MPARELTSGSQVENWLQELAASLTTPASLILIGSGGLLWHAARKGVSEKLPTNSMDIDPITESEEVAMHCYDGQIGSEFEKTHGWHLNIMPRSALNEMPADWEKRQTTHAYGLLTVHVPSPDDLLVPKVKRGEPRDLAHARWAFLNGLSNRSHTPLVPKGTSTYTPPSHPNELLP